MLTIDASRIAAAIPEYEVDRELGRGGMGVVYLGRHRRLDRPVAIKELPGTFAAEPEVRARFSTEAQTLAGLSHPHIVPIFDYVEREGLCLIVMEQLPGGTVWDRFTSTGLTPPTTCGVVMACCAALQYAHDKSVLHLDVKPDNLMFDAQDAVKVTDFGIARVITGDRTLGTVDGQVLGTPAYMSPEQARGDELTPASDVYAAGVMLYELLSGQLPWLGAQSASELLAQRLDEDPVPLGAVAPHLPSSLVAVVMQALSRTSEARYQRAEDLGVAIGEACVAAWGEDWLDHSGVAVFGSGRLARAARTTGSRAPVAAAPTAAPPAATRAPGDAPATVDRARAEPGQAPGTVVTGAPGTPLPGAVRTAAPGAAAARLPGAAGTVAPGAADPRPPGAARTAAAGVAVPPPPPGARSTEERNAPPGPPPAPPTMGAPGPAGGPGGFEAVRAAGDEPRILGADLYDLELADLIGVEDVLDPPKPPWPALVVTAVLVLATIAIAAIGLGTPVRDEGLATGDVALDGQDVATGDRVELDLSEPLTVRVADGRLRARTDEVEVAFGWAGAELTRASAPVRDGVAEVDPGLAQRLIGGQATATVTLSSADGDVLATHDLPVRARQTWYLTAPAVGGALLLLLALANLESSLKPLRSGRPRRLSSVGAFVSGGLLGPSVVLVAAATGASEPTVPALVAAAALGAGAGVAAAAARVGVARRRRVRQAVRRAERTLGVSAGR